MRIVNFRGTRCFVIFRTLLAYYVEQSIAILWAEAALCFRVVRLSVRTPLLRAKRGRGILRPACRRLTVILTFVFVMHTFHYTIHITIYTAVTDTSPLFNCQVREGRERTFT